MKKAFIFVLLMLSELITPGGRGQETATRARSAVPLPSICTPRTSTTAADTIAVNNVYYVCTAPNTWTAVRGLEADHEFTGNNCFKSYAPWADVTCWGARPASWYGISTNTVKMAKGSKILDLSDPGFQNGDGVTIWKAGTAHALPAPAAPTVTPSIAAGGTMSGIVKTTVAGSTTDNYLVIGRTKYGGLTAAGSVGTTPAAQARLGLTTAKITNCTLVLDVITCETSAPTLLAAGSLVHMRAGSNADFTGWFTVDHMNTASEFVINGSILDSRAYGQFYRDAANSVGGTAYYYLGNHLTWTPSVASGTPAWEYYVCAKRAGESFFHLIGQTTPSVPGGWSDTQFDDFGSPFMDKQHYPAYIETVAEAAFNAANPVTSAADAICTSVAPTPDPLTTIITSGAGTGTLRVRDASSSAIEKNGTILYDAAPNILAAATYMARAGGGSNSAGVLYFPPASNSPAASGYPINSYLKLPAGYSIFQSGNLNLGETLEVQGNTTWDGHWSQNGIPQFGFAGTAAITGLGANPLIYSAGGPGPFSYLTFNGYAGNGGVGIVCDCTGADFDYVNFLTGGVDYDVLSMNMILRSMGSGGNSYHFRKTLFNAGPDQLTDKSWTPLVYMPPNQNGNGGLLYNQGFALYCDACFLNRRGFEEEMYGGNGGQKEFIDGYRQGGITPVFMVGNHTGRVGGWFRFSSFIQDTESLPTIAFIGNPTGAAVQMDGVMDSSADLNSGSAPPSFTGFRPASSLVLNSAAGKAPMRNGQMIGPAWNGNCLVVYPIDTTGNFGCTVHAPQYFYDTVLFPTGHSMNWPLAPPTMTNCTAAPGGGLVSTTKYFYIVSSNDAVNQESIPAVVPCSATSSGENRTVKMAWIQAPSGVANSSVYRCTSTGNNCTLPDGRATGDYHQVALHVTGTSYTDAQVNHGTWQTPPSAGAASATNVSGAGVHAPLVQADTISAGPAGAFGSAVKFNASACEIGFGETTFATGTKVVDTGLNCLPANAIIDYVVYRITKTITETTSFTIGDANIAARFCAMQSTLTVETTGVCFAQADQTGTSGPRQISAAPLRLTFKTKPGVGAMRMIVYYHTVIPPSS